jgi:hypothetical protein
MRYPIFFLLLQLEQNLLTFILQAKHVANQHVNQERQHTSELIHNTFTVPVFHLILHAISELFYKMGHMPFAPQRLMAIDSARTCASPVLGNPALQLWNLCSSPKLLVKRGFHHTC